jgi:hypothetical protein
MRPKRKNVEAKRLSLVQKGGPHSVNIQGETIDINFQYVIDETEKPKQPNLDQRVSASTLSSCELLDLLCSRTDDLVLPAIRDHRNLAYSGLLKVYKSIIGYELGRYKLSGDDLLRFLNRLGNTAAASRIVPSPVVNIVVPDDFAEVTFSLGDKTMVVPGPALIWDCSCGADPKASEKCPIHRQEMGASIEKHFRMSLVAFKIFDAVLLWRNADYFFPPSADAFWFIHDLMNARVFDDVYRGVLDLGCGTGFLGIMTCKKCKTVERVHFSDWLLTPLYYSSLNFVQNVLQAQQLPVRSAFLLGPNADWINADDSSPPYDMVLCNPPYLPMVAGFEELAMCSTVAGTELLEFAISHKSKLGKKLFLAFSNIVSEEARSAERRITTGETLVPIGPARKVPFRNPYAVSIPGYLEYLVKNRGLIYERGNRYPYWHYVRTYAVA